MFQADEWPPVDLVEAFAVPARDGFAAAKRD
jgi:hypothetical protein